MRKISIRWRLILIFGLVLMPVCALIFMIQANFFSIMKRQASMYTAQYIEKISYDIELNLSELDKMALTLRQDPAILEALSGGETAGAQQRLEQVLEQNPLALKTESALLLLDGGQRIIASTYGEWTGLLRMLGPQWLNKIVGAKGGRVLISGYSITKGADLNAEKVVSLARGIFQGERLLGYLMAEVPAAAITQLCQGVSLGNNGFVALVDGDDYVIYNTKAETMGSKFMRLEPAGDGKKYYETTIKGLQMLVVEVPAAVSGIRVVGAIPVEELEEELVAVRQGAVWAMAAISLVMLAAATYFTHRLCRPILEMERGMKRVEGGDFSVRVAQNRSDEIGSLQTGFNHMVGRVDELIAKEYKTALRQREAQLNEMMSIINPHFIYNTLEAISMTAYLNGDEQVVEMTGRLGDIFRALTGDGGTRLLPLRQEVETVENYLALINVRQDGQIHVIWQVDEQLLNARIMKFTLQPIVENSVVHGFSGKGGGHIWITIQGGRGGEVQITVEDDGQGVDEATLARLRRILAGEEPSGQRRPLALQNVHDRLRLAFGPGYGVEVAHRPQGGLRVTLAVPGEEEA